MDDLFGNLMFKIGLTVEVLGLHVADTLRLRAAAKDHIGREELIALYFDDVADFNLVPLAGVEPVGGGVIGQTLLLVLLPV